MGLLLKLFTGNPLMMVYVAAGIAAVSAAGGAYTGWTANGWRLGAKLATCEGENVALRDKLVFQNAAVDTLKHESDKRVQAAQDGVAAAQEETATQRTEADRLRQQAKAAKRGAPRSASCPPSGADLAVTAIRQGLK